MSGGADEESEKVMKSEGANLIVTGHKVEIRQPDGANAHGFTLTPEGQAWRFAPKGKAISNCTAGNAAKPLVTGRSWAASVLCVAVVPSLTRSTAS